MSTRRKGRPATAKRRAPVKPHVAAGKKGPAVERLEASLKEHRRPFPPVLRVSLIGFAVAVLGLAATLGLAFLVDRTALWQMLAFQGFLVVGGPQSATLWAFTSAQPPLAIGWVIAVTLANTLATLLLIVPVAWRGFERLRDARFVGGAITSSERFAMDHREFLDRYGLVGLVLVAILPMPGAGVLGAGILGVLLRIPLGRLLATLATAGTVLALAWVLAVHQLGAIIPSGWWSDYLPYALILAVVGAGAVAQWRGRKRRFNLAIDALPWIDAGHRAELRRVGVTHTAQLFNVNLKRLSQRLGIPEDELGRARATADLLRLNSVSPEDAERLTAAGVKAVREVAKVPAEVLQQALEEVAVDKPAPSLTTVRRWKEEAKEFQVELKRQQKDAKGQAKPKHDERLGVVRRHDRAAPGSKRNTRVDAGQQGRRSRFLAARAPFRRRKP